MSVGPGTSFGHFEILESIGAGGMGEVYRARDSKLERDVAIKILPDAFARDSERLGRFQREARLLAALNRPKPISRTQTPRAAVAGELMALSHRMKYVASDFTGHLGAVGMGEAYRTKDTKLVGS